MSDLSVTPANVVAAAGASVQYGTAGATITAGQLVYKDSADGRIKLARANVAGTAELVGVSQNGAANGQPISYIVGGDYNPGATVTVGTVYDLSAAAAGGVAPEADLATTNRVSVFGVGTTTSNIKIAIINSGVAKP